MALALAELRDPLYDALITGHTPFAELPTAMSQLDQLGGGRWCHVVDYRHLEHSLADDPHMRGVCEQDTPPRQLGRQ